jgi:hypothetical protein
MAKPRILTAARLRKILHYNPHTGQFRWIGDDRHQLWKEQRWREKVGCVQTQKSGYRRHVITIDYQHYMAHRLAWLYMTGDWPEYNIDHINRRSLDNRWVNLRLAPKSLNYYNRGNPRNNTSGHRGVIFVRLLKPWKAFIGNKSLGYFFTKKEAIVARKAAESMLNQ